MDSVGKLIAKIHSLLNSTGVTAVGAAADGAAASGNPVQAAGKDPAGNVQALLTDTDGRLRTKPFTHTHTSGDHVTSTANTAASLTLAAAGAGVSNVINGIFWSYSGADPTTGKITVQDGATTVFEVSVTAKGPGFLPVRIKGSANTALVLTIAAGGGASDVGKLNIGDRWTEAT